MTQHILITGATSGIGHAIASKAAAQGFAISFTGIEAEADCQDICEGLKALGAADVRYVQIDLADGVAARQLVEEAHQAHGRLDMLVNNAGIQHVSSVEDFPISAWDKLLAVNLSAPFHTSAAALPLMRASDYGRIVNIASVHGLVASAQKAAYVAAKHGIIGLTKTIALETAGVNITCNAICPGWVRTALVEAQIEARAQQAGRGVEEEARLLLGEKQPSQAFVTPQDIAEMTLFLASKAASQITGSHFVMDGGWTAQ